MRAYGFTTLADTKEHEGSAAAPEQLKDFKNNSWMTSFGIEYTHDEKLKPMKSTCFANTNTNVQNPLKHVDSIRSFKNLNFVGMKKVCIGIFLFSLLYACEKYPVFPALR